MPANSSLESPVVRWSSSAIWRLGLPLALFGVLWADLIHQLSYNWETNEQYAYGWFVPFFALALFWKRWTTRSGAGAGRLDHETTGPQDSSSVVHGPVVSSPVVRVLIVLLALCLLPIRVVYEINPDWPLCSWLMTLVVVGMSLYAVFLAGGWRWVRHFAFPVCFILVAVQWPYRIEHGLTQGLMRVVAGITVELLGWFDIPAFQHGNLIELSTGVLGIDEACSGIRSFQSSLMAALLMGELYRLRLLPRAILVLCGLTLGFCFNVVRTLLLSWQANAHGLSAIDKWHDPAGMTIAVACFFALWAIAVWLRARLDHGPRTTDPQPPVAPLLPREMASSPISPGPLLPREMTSSPISPGSLSPREMAKQPISPGSLPRTFLLAVGGWAILCLVATEVWYHSHDIKEIGVFHWSVMLPETNPTFQKIELPPRTVQLLAYDYGTTGRWLEEGGAEWNLSFFRWNPRSMQSVIRARGHRPEYCLPASGLKQSFGPELVYLEAGSLNLPFHKYVYEAEGRNLYVFFCLWEDGQEQQQGMRTLDKADRLKWVLAGRRGLGQQTLEIILSGYQSLDEAQAAVTARLPNLIKIETMR